MTNTLTDFPINSEVGFFEGVSFHPDYYHGKVVGHEDGMLKIYIEGYTYFVYMEPELCYPHK